MGTLNILVIYDRWEEPEEQGAVAAPDKAPLTRTLDKKEVEDEVAEALGKLGHQATLHVLDGALKSLHALSRSDCDLVFNLAESFAGNDTADYCIAAYLEPSADVGPYTRTVFLPSPPLDRLFVDRSRRVEARDLVDEHAPPEADGAQVGDRRRGPAPERAAGCMSTCSARRWSGWRWSPA